MWEFFFFFFKCAFGPLCNLVFPNNCKHHIKYWPRRVGWCIHIQWVHILMWVGMWDNTVLALSMLIYILIMHICIIMIWSELVRQDSAVILKTWVMLFFKKAIDSFFISYLYILWVVETLACVCFLLVFEYQQSFISDIGQDEVHLSVLRQ